MEEFRRALAKLKSKGAQDLILDLSDNGGGYLNTAIEMADEFLDDNKLIVYTEGTTSPKSMSYASSKGSFEKGKLIVLINENSASASEIVSGAIQDWDRGIIIGRRSYGKGLVQKPFPLSDGSVIRLTTARYYTPVGRCIQKPYDNGLEAYYKDLNERYAHGELTTKDSIHFPDSLKFYTPNHRLVYGGGGVMPDIFVPMDTSKNTAYNSELIRKSVLNNFSFELVDKYRNILGTAYPNISDFKKRFKVDRKMFDDLVAYAEREGVRKDEKAIEISREVIEIQLKALIARDIWGNDEFYEVINELNPAYTKALEAYKSDGFKKLRINSFSMK
jgi:carboxyl-terminal processing protease